MSRRNNNVRGPTSALTEFLRESGITPTTVASRAAMQPPPVAGPSNAAGGEDGEGEEVVQEENTPRRLTRSTRRSVTWVADGNGSDNLDDPEEEEEATPARKRKLSKAALAKDKENAKKKAKRGKKADGDGDGDDDDYDEEDDVYNALSKSLWTKNASSSSKPPVGSFDDCARCDKQFTVTKYTMAANPGPGFLCHACAKASGADPFKKPAPPKKRRAPEDKRVVLHFEERRFPTLAALCCQIISEYIDDVEALGDIGSINMEQISKALARNRSLTAENAKLFYNIQNTTLTLHDATKIRPPGFNTLASLNPNLTSLRLDFCGCIDDSVILSWVDALPALRRLELLGPFLVRPPSWATFFRGHPALEGFLITQSPRFDTEALTALVDSCTGLRELRLREIGKMGDEFVEEIRRCSGGLELLDLAEPTQSCSDDALIGLMQAVGASLKHLDLSGHINVTDTFLHEGIKPFAPKLVSLTLSDLPELTDSGVGEFFETWAAEIGEMGPDNMPPLTSIDLSRNHVLGDKALAGLLRHCGPALARLNINSWRATSEAALAEIPQRAKALRMLDVGWCRAVDDFFVKAVMDECGKIERVMCWGCNRLTDNCPRRRGVNIYGLESQRLL